MHSQIPAIAAAQDVPSAHPRGSLSPSRMALVAYWVCTLSISLAALGASIQDILHLQPLHGILLHLGYPPYFGTMLGVWKVLGAVALLAPGLPLVKEWAYAGMFFNYSAALVSHFAVGDGAGVLVGPIVSIGALAASWYLRPQSRRGVIS